MEDNRIQHMRFSSWTIKATDTHSEYIIFIDSPWQKLFCKRSFTDIPYRVEMSLEYDVFAIGPSLCQKRHKRLEY
jgi:hypothetical protein